MKKIMLGMIAVLIACALISCSPSGGTGGAGSGATGGETGGTTAGSTGSDGLA